MMPRLRVAKKAHTELKKEDPDTQVTVSAIRRWMADGDIPVVHTGNRTFVNYDALLEFLRTGNGTSNPVEPEAQCEIRRID